MTAPAGMCTKINTTPNMMSASSAQKQTRETRDRSVRLAYPKAPQPATNSAVAPPACHNACGSALA